jgi:polyisoprenoid-binding protein YceI
VGAGAKAPGFVPGRRGMLALALGAAAALCGSAFTQPAATPAPQLAAPLSPQPGNYRVEPDHTEVMFGVNHLGFTMYYGVFSHASGTLVLDPADPSASRLEVSVPVNSVLTPNPRLNQDLQGPRWLNAASFPDMTFRSTRITRTGPDTALVEGDLTLHGVTRPVTLKARFNHGGENPLDHHYTLGFHARGVIKRSDFGVSAYVPMVGNDVHLNISAAFERAPTSP